MRSEKNHRLMSEKRSASTRKAGSDRVFIMALEPRVLYSAASLLHAHAHHSGATNRITTTLTGGAKQSTTLTAPSSLAAQLQTASSAALSWALTTTSASGYRVLRSIDGGGFSTLVNIGSSTASSYADTSLAAGHTYTYEVEAYSGSKVTSPSNKASVTTTLTAPSAPQNLAATSVGSWISLSWTATSASGFYVLRSTDGLTYSQIAQITSGSTTSYADSAVVAGQTYYYEVQAYNSAGTSAPCSAYFITAPTASSNGVAVSTRFGDELVINATGANDAISITQSGSTLNIFADGQSYADPTPAAGVFVYTRGGSDSISVDASVSAAVTLETIDGSTTAITSGGANVNAWVDSTDSYTGTGTVHRVSSFAGAVSKAVGASLADPSDSGTVTKVNLSLWGTGPVVGDVNQGAVGDCYFLSSLAAFAQEKPSVLMQSAVDMGDGTYVVQFMSGTTPTFVRVSNDMPTGPFAGFMEAQPGVNQTMWAMVMEKAFCEFRSGANTYASIASGWMGEAYSDLGVSSSSFSPGGYTDSTLFSLLNSDLTKGEAVTLATSTSAPNLVSNHAYTLVSVYTNSSGVNEYVVRNPWGVSGDSLENSQGYATLTFAQLTANFTMGCQAIG